jgi:sugar lactone lactonase YvrE
MNDLKNELVTSVKLTITYETNRRSDKHRSMTISHFRGNSINMKQPQNENFFKMIPLNSVFHNHLILPTLGYIKLLKSTTASMKKTLFVSTIVFACLSFSQAQTYTISTFAGNGEVGFSGDGGIATAAQIYAYDVAVDASGNLYVADADNNRIRKISTGGIISTFAGTGIAGFSGDGAAATSAELNGPTGVTLDASGNVYIADYGNNCIRKINSGGIISTIAGNGTAGFSGDGAAATAAELNTPYKVAVDASGNVYIADLTNNRIRMVSPGGLISTFAGNGTGGFSGDGAAATSAKLHFPEGVAVDAAGNVYIADRANNRIREVNTGGIISTFAGTGFAGFSGDGAAATLAKLSNPGSVTLDASGNVYIADRTNNRIRMITSGGIISTVAGNGTAGFSGDGAAATSSELNGPWGVTVDGSGNIYVADQSNLRIRKVNISGIISTIAGTGSLSFWGDGGPATSAELHGPAGLTLDASGNMYITDRINNRIRKVSSGGIISTVAGNGTAGFFGDGAAATSAEINSPYGIVIDTIGNLYISDQNNNRIRMVNTSGIISTVAGSGTGGFSGDSAGATLAYLNSPYGITLDAARNLYISDDNNQRIRKVSTGGIIYTVAGNGTQGFAGDGTSAFTAELYHPAGVTFDGTGNMYIADQSNNRIRKISPSGIISTIAGNGAAGFSGDGAIATSAELNGPIGVAVDGALNVYIADLNNNRIRRVSSSGIISTIAGIGTQGFSGDGAGATSAELSAPDAIAVDVSGNIYIADAGNNRIRKLTPNALGVNALKEENPVHVYPNPFGGTFTLELNSTVSVKDVAFYNLLGELVGELKLSPGKNLINLSNIVSGVYLYKIYTEEGTLLTAGMLIKN